MTDHPGTQPSSEVRRAEAEQLAVGVDLVVLAGGVRLRRAETLGEPDEHDPGCGPRSAEVVVESDAVGRPQLGQPTGDLPDDGDPFVGQVEELDHNDPERHGHERSGDRRREATQSEDDGERRGADGERPCLGVAEVSDDSPQLLEEVALFLLDAEQLGNLADHDRQGEADDEPLEHWLGDEVGEKSEAQQSGSEGEQPGHQGEHTRERQHLVGTAGREVGHRRRRERGGGRHRSDDEMARTAERGVEDQRRRRGIEADHGRNTGDRRVGQRLGDEHRPHGEPGEQVTAEPRPVVAGERAKDRQVHADLRSEDRRPVVLDADHGPPGDARPLEGLLGAGGVVELALGIVVQQEGA